MKSAIRKVNAVVKRHNAIYVSEFKMNGTAEEALAQINNKGYAISYEADHRKVVKGEVNATHTVEE